MCGQQDLDQLDADIGDAFSEFFGRVIGKFEAMARRYCLPAFAIKAVHMLAAPVPMKELGRRFHCDPSFVTAIADLLDTNGLAQREPDSRDRRIKHLKLTSKGLKLRERIEREVFTEMPWHYGLDAGERRTLLALLRKMIKAESERDAQVTAAGTEPDSTTVAAGQAASEAGAHDAGYDTPPAMTGGDRAGGGDARAHSGHV